MSLNFLSGFLLFYILLIYTVVVFFMRIVLIIFRSRICICETLFWTYNKNDPKFSTEITKNVNKFKGNDEIKNPLNERKHKNQTITKQLKHSLT